MISKKIMKIAIFALLIGMVLGNALFAGPGCSKMSAVQPAVSSTTTISSVPQPVQPVQAQAAPSQVPQAQQRLAQRDSADEVSAPVAPIGRKTVYSEKTETTEDAYTVPGCTITTVTKFIQYTDGTTSIQKTQKMFATDPLNHYIAAVAAQKQQRASAIPSSISSPYALSRSPRLAPLASLQGRNGATSSTYIPGPVIPPVKQAATVHSAGSESQLFADLGGENSVASHHSRSDAQYVPPVQEPAALAALSNINNGSSGMVITMGSLNAESRQGSASSVQSSSGSRRGSLKVSPSMASRHHNTGQQQPSGNSSSSNSPSGVGAPRAAMADENNSK